MPTLRIIEIEGTVDECLALGNAFIFQRSEERIGKEQKPEARDAPASGASHMEAPVTQEPEKAQLTKEPQVKGLPKEEATKKVPLQVAPVPALPHHDDDDEPGLTTPEQSVMSRSICTPEKHYQTHGRPPDDDNDHKQAKFSIEGEHDKLDESFDHRLDSFFKMSQAAATPCEDEEEQKEQENPPNNATNTLGQPTGGSSHKEQHERLRELDENIDSESEPPGFIQKEDTGSDNNVEPTNTASNTLKQNHGRPPDDDIDDQIAQGVLCKPNDTKVKHYQIHGRPPDDDFDAKFEQNTISATFDIEGEYDKLRRRRATDLTLVIKVPS